MLTQIGKVVFDPPPIIDFHTGHRTVILEVPVGYEGLYRWLIKKELGLDLIKPVREGHITIVSWYESDNISEEVWEQVKSVWEGQAVEVWYHLPNSDLNVPYWWLRLDEGARIPLHCLRTKLGLPERPKSGLHLTIGTVKEKDKELSDYFVSVLQRN